MKELLIGSDHAGFALKKTLIAYLHERGWSILDKGTYSEEPVDYPDYAHLVANMVSERGVLGILLCGSANGVCMAANKHQKIRAALCWKPEIAVLARQHNDANVLCLPARFVSDAEAIAITDAFLTSVFEGGRHERRVNKIACA